MTNAAEEARAPDARDTDQMGGFAKGLAVIEAFGRGRSALTIAEVARLVDLDRAAVRRCLRTLVNAGYATSGGRYFELTPRILRLGHAYLAASLPRLIQPSLDRLAHSVHEFCSASVLDGAEIVYVARASRHRLMGVGLHAGSRLPAYCTSMGRVLLAALSPEQSRAIILENDRHAITARTITDPNELMKELQKVRDDGYSLVDQELEIGSRSIAVPVRNISGNTIMAITVAAHATRASLRRMREEILPRLLEAQQALAEILP